MSKVKIVKFIIVILGSSLFIPVSCTIGVVGGIQTIAWTDSRNVQNGDEVHSLFSVVATRKGNENQDHFVVIPLYCIEQFKRSNEPFSFLMPLSRSSMENDQSHYTYKVLEDQESEQTIEVIEAYKDGDNTIWSQYRATEKEIFPISSRMLYFGYMFQALPYGLAFSLCIYAFGKILQRRFRKLYNNNS